MEIPASRCSRCGRVCAPPTHYCPDDGTPMIPAEAPGYGEVLSFTTLHSPPTGFASPLHMALVELEGGVKFFCHGTGTRGLKVGSHVSIEAVGEIYYFSMLSLGERARLFWRRGGIRATQRIAAFARSAAQRVTRPRGGGRPSA
jgi:acyl-CoA-associated DUF35 OB-fold domain-containing protein